MYIRLKVFRKHSLNTLAFNLLSICLQFEGFFDWIKFKMWKEVSINGRL
nr:MAG TPA: hypothetical protein [Caudoviricetes sp.]